MENTHKDNKTALYLALSEVPLDIEGSNISLRGWYPSEEDKEMMGGDWQKATDEAIARDEKVYFKNIHLVFDSCDCEYGGCGHGEWLFEINVFQNGNKYTIEIDDEKTMYMNVDGKTSANPIEGANLFDFYRMCEIVGVKLEITQYGNLKILEKLDLI